VRRGGAVGEGGFVSHVRIAQIDVLKLPNTRLAGGQQGVEHLALALLRPRAMEPVAIKFVHVVEREQRVEIEIIVVVERQGFWRVVENEGGRHLAKTLL
jgi:hypothetical protein